MVGCLYELNGEIKAYPNKDRLLKKIPDAKIIKEVPDINDLDRELLRYKGIEVKDKVQQQDVEYEYQYRVNCNTVLCAHNLEDLNKLKAEYNVI